MSMHSVFLESKELKIKLLAEFSRIDAYSLYDLPF